MRVFAEHKYGEHWPSKVNFVDDNNVVVGYDMAQDCCENADWFIADKPTLELQRHEVNQDQESDYPGYNFVDHYLMKIEGGDFDGGGMVVFQLRRGDGWEDLKYLHLYNVHNGYYSHGFTLKTPYREESERL